MGLVTGSPLPDRQALPWQPTDHAFYASRACDVFDELPKWCVPCTASCVNASPQSQAAERPIPSASWPVSHGSAQRFTPHALASHIA